ncbi:hypothetical protein [Acinetobacter ihumii]|uniref:hypothetical protein n=1 Tax=Acinetobacter ihumii TaxID=2483802 RepID=UPI001031852E|nr:hypothetical protein [Acinetobacter ihumii]
MREKLSPEKSIWGWKLLIIAIILAFLFMWVFYLALNNEPDYMPSHKQKQMQMQHQMQSDAAKDDAMPMDMKDMPMHHQHTESSSDSH